MFPVTSPSPPPVPTQAQLAQSLQAARETLAKLRATLAQTAKVVGTTRAKTVRA
ncbi:MAG TPA: hypothetical protein VIG99_23290 [Myxococcaceae bacterium]|jgi:hypothetical protein